MSLRPVVEDDDPYPRLPDEDKEWQCAECAFSVQFGDDEYKGRVQKCPCCGHVGELV